MPTIDVFEHVLGSAVVVVYTRFVTLQRADSISTMLVCDVSCAVKSSQSEPLQSEDVWKAKISDSFSPEGEGVMLACVWLFSHVLSSPHLFLR